MTMFVLMYASLVPPPTDWTWSAIIRLVSPRAVWTSLKVLVPAKVSRNPAYSPTWIPLAVGGSSESAEA